jgi:hypothetical protein
MRRAKGWARMEQREGLCECVADGLSSVGRRHALRGSHVKYHKVEENQTQSIKLG